MRHEVAATIVASHLRKRGFENLDTIMVVGNTPHFSGRHPHSGSVFASFEAGLSSCCGPRDEAPSDWPGLVRRFEKVAAVRREAYRHNCGSDDPPAWPHQDVYIALYSGKLPKPIEEIARLASKLNSGLVIVRPDRKVFSVAVPGVKEVFETNEAEA